MSWRTKVVVGAVAVAVLAAGGAVYTLLQGSGASTETATCDYAEHYSSPATLAAHSDLVVAGQVGKKLGTTSDAGGGATDFAFAVTSVLSDHGRQLSQSAGTVKVHQTGTSDRTQCREDPLFTTGSAYVLFLHEYAPGSFYVVGGPNGRLVVSGGHVSPFSDDSVQFSGSLDALAAALR